LPGRVRIEKETHLLAKADQHLPGGSLGNLGLDLVIARGQGSHVWDVSGNEYVDYLLGSGPMVTGHSHPEVVEAVRDQLDRGTTFFATNEYAILLAEEIVSAVPCADSVRFSSTGTEATHYAMRAARAYRRRDKILKFEGGYHGMNDYALMSMMPLDPSDFPKPTPDSAGIPRSVQNDVIIAPFNDIETTSDIIDLHHEELAAVIVEPMQRVIPPARGFLEGLREITERYTIPLIFDEVVTGFRLSYGGAQEHYGVTPDLCTLGKAVGGGFPLTAIAGREEIMRHFNAGAVDADSFMPQIGTLSGNPVAAIAGLATLKILKRDGQYEKLFATGKRVMDTLQRLLDEAEIPAKVVGVPPVFDVLFTCNEITDYRSTLTQDKEFLMRFNRLLLDRGVFKGDTKYYLSLAHTKEDLELTFEAFSSAIAELS